MTTYRNGYLPTSALRPIGGGYYLRSDAAAAFIAMSDEAYRRYGVHITVVAGYRPYEKQVYFWNLYLSGRGNLAAHPGTSNHGWGLAVDLASPRMRWIVDQIGAKYGFSKSWSDAPSEWWHIKWQPGHYKPPAKVDPLRALTVGERKLVTRLNYHRHQMSIEEKSGRGPKYEENLKWARWYKSEIKKQMHRIVLVVRANGGHWKTANRGVRYQILKKAYEGK